MSNTKALLLAGGLGTRLRPYTEVITKCLVPVGNLPLLHHWVHALEKAGIREALINTHHKAEQVRGCIAASDIVRRVRFQEMNEPRLLGSAGTLRAACDWLTTSPESMIVYADNFSEIDLGALLEFHRGHDDSISMALFRTDEPWRCGVVGLDTDRRITSFVEKPTHPSSNLANAGTYVMDASAIREIADSGGFDLALDVLPAFVRRMRGFEVEGYHRDIGTPDSLQEARIHAAVDGEEAAARHQAVFFDRDGTLIEHVHHLSDPRRVRLKAGAAMTIQELRDRGFLNVLATNQSVVGRGMLSEEGLQAVNDEMYRQLNQYGASMDAAYACTVAPSGTGVLHFDSYDRKPMPGLLLRAARDLNIDITRSWMVGDSLTDAIAGRLAGVRGTILIGNESCSEIVEGLRTADFLDHHVGDIEAACRVIQGAGA